MDDYYEGIIESNKGIYIGDICYALGKRVYNGFWGEKCDYEDGIYENVLGTGRTLAVCTTGIGDGTYYSDNGYEFPVDAGVLGVVPVELSDLDREEGEDLTLDYDPTCGHVVTVEDGQRVVCAFSADRLTSDNTLFEFDVRVVGSDGRTVLRENFTVETNPEEDEDEDEYDYEEEDEDEEDEDCEEVDE